MFFSVFGAAWLVLWCLQAYGVNPGIIAAIGVLTIVLFLASLRQFRQNRSAHAAEAETPAAKREGHIFNIVNAVQWILVAIVANVLNLTGHKEWIVPSIIFIVGAHFFPLAVLFKYRRHYFTGAAMVLVAVLYPLISQDGAASPTGCLWAGIILWASSVRALMPATDS